MNPTKVFVRPLLHDDIDDREIRDFLDDIGIKCGKPFVVCHPDVFKLDGQGGARRSDPATSKRAAVEVAPRVGSKRRAVLETFDRRSVSLGFTASEAEHYSQVSGAWKRVSELAQGGFIRATGDVRHIPATGKQQQVYVITEKGRAAIRR